MLVEWFGLEGKKCMRIETKSKIYFKKIKQDGNIKNRQMFEENEMNVLRKIVGKTKIARILSQQIRESCGI